MMIRMEVKSIRIHSVTRRMTDPARISSNAIWFGSIPVLIGLEYATKAGLLYYCLPPVVEGVQDPFLVPAQKVQPVELLP